MVAALHMVGFGVWDVNMQDLCLLESFSLDEFLGIIFIGGFSYMAMFSDQQRAGQSLTNTHVCQVRVSLLDCPDRVESIDNARKDGGIRTGSLGGTRRRPHDIQESGGVGRRLCPKPCSC